MICCLPSNHHCHLLSIHHLPTCPSSLLALISIIKPRISIIITIPCVCQDPWICWVKWELDLGSGCQWDILEYLLLKLPPPQVLPLKLRHLQDFPQDILLPILCWTGSVAGIGSHLVCCCRGWDSLCWVGVYVFKVMLSASIALFVSGFHMVGVLKLMCQPAMWSDHVIVGIFIVVYSSIDPINTPCLSPPSCLSTSNATLLGIFYLFW